MEGKRKPNSMLIELVIVILFFSLSAGIVLQLFVAAGDKAVQSATQTSALVSLEDLAERFVGSGEPADAFFAADGWQASAEGYTKQMEHGGHTLDLILEGGVAEGEAGQHSRYTVTAYEGERQLVSLPISRYTPKEVAHE